MAWHGMAWRRQLASMIARLCTPSAMITRNSAANAGPTAPAEALGIAEESVPGAGMAGVWHAALAATRKRTSPARTRTELHSKKTTHALIGT
jgi:hypothetical protein